MFTHNLQVKLILYCLFGILCLDVGGYMKKGFTLIELLAVIVILAIIALISVPLISNIIENSKKSSFLVSVNGILEATEYDSLEKGNDYYFPESGLNFKGEDLKGGYISIKNGKSLVLVYNDNYCVTKDFDDTKLSISEIPSSECEKYMDKEKAFTFDSKTGTITRYDESYGLDVVIPYSINGVPVKKIGDSAFVSDYNKEIVRVIDRTTGICSKLAEAGNYCYYDYTYEYAIANNIKYDQYIRYTFTSDTKKICYNLDGNHVIVGNDEVKSINDGYYGCRFEATSGTGNIVSLDLSHANQLEEIGNLSFFKNKLDNVKWNSNIKIIGNAAFASNNISEINLSNSKLEVISYEAFGQNKLKNLDLSGNSNLKTIQSGAFLLNDLVTINLGSSKDLTIEDNTFIKNKEYNSNPNLTSIINGTGNSYNWSAITEIKSTNSDIFETGIIKHSDGNITVSK